MVGEFNSRHGYFRFFSIYMYIFFLFNFYGKVSRTMSTRVISVSSVLLIFLLVDRVQCQPLVWSSISKGSTMLGLVSLAAS